MFGIVEVRIVIGIARITMDIVSFSINRGLNFTLSVLNFVCKGFEDPFSCNRIRCIITNNATIMGNRKCNEKKRFSVGCDTEGPPQIQVTKSVPIRGIADRTPVITVAPQNDICPHGKTYPKKAVAITVNMIITPESHTFFWFAGELKYIPRAA